MLLAASPPQHLQLIPAGGGALYNDWNRLTEQVESICNPNLLINPDFTNPVNQRGKTEYTGYGYTIDMWNHLYPTTTKLINGCVVLEPTQEFSEALLVQRIENGLALLNGKMATLSIMLGDGTILSSSGVININAGWEGSLGIIFNNYLIAHLQQLGEMTYPNELAFVIKSRSNTNRFKAAKLELGAVSTLKNEIVNYAEELRKCQRYYHKVIGGYLNETPYVMCCDEQLTRDLQGSVFYPAEMRIYPTISNVKVRNMVNGQTGEITQCAIAGNKNGFNAIYGVVSEMTFIPGMRYTVMFEASAEL